MRRRVLSLRLRSRRWLAAKGMEGARLVGRHPFWAGFTGTLAASVMAGLTFQSLYAGRAEDLRHAAEHSRNVVQMIAGDLSRNIEIDDLSLQAIVAGAESADTWTLPARLRQSVLFDGATTATYIGGAYVLDATGHVKAAQPMPENLALSFARRDYFTAQQHDPHARLYVSKPFRSMARHGLLTVGLTRRIDAPDGRFDGVALLAVRLDYFQHLVDRVDVGPRGTVAIFLRDGILLASRPALPRGIAADYSDVPSLQRIREARSGTFMMVTRLDGVARMYTYTHLDNAPLLVVVAPAVDDVLAEWRSRSRFAIALTVVLGGACVALSWLFAFALRDKVVAEAKLMRLAVTDPLTGLANRRALDRRLASEWQQAVRARTPLSVLFIDIDHFKRFNDTYGHAAGDDVLCLVAEQLTSATRRATDIVARYGGEEFVVILPQTSTHGATQIAKKIRRRVAELNVEHPETPAGRVTVSIGCASCEPPCGGSAAKLVAAADRQLYEAKANGRDQVRARVLTDDDAAPPRPRAPHGAPM